MHLIVCPSLLALISFFPHHTLRSLPPGVLSNTSQSIQSSHTNYCLYPVLTLELCLYHQTTRDSSCAPEPSELKLVSTKPASLSSPVPSQRNHSKCSSSEFPLSLCSVVDPRAFPCGLHALSSWLLELINYFFNGNCFLICWPYYNSNFLLIHYILKEQPS